MIIHNAPFDTGFLNAELARLDMAPVDTVCHTVLDTLRMARERHPGKKNNLDALCERYGVSNAHRSLHGAMLDAELLAEVYVAMTRGQESLDMELISSAPEATGDLAPLNTPAAKPSRIVRADENELAQHAALLATIQKESRGKCLWLAKPPSAEAAES